MAALYKEQLGELIAARRRALGLTQRDLADRAHVKETTTVSRWERGERAPSDLDAVAAALETTAAAMLAELTPVGQTDRRRLSREGGTQLDQIEADIGELGRKVDKLTGMFASFTDPRADLFAEFVRGAAEAAQALKSSAI